MSGKKKGSSNKKKATSKTLPVAKATGESPPETNPDGPLEGEALEAIQKAIGEGDVETAMSLMVAVERSYSRPAARFQAMAGPG